ncbi:3'-5' exonuclease [Vibrio tasmaniensis]|uniref:3'-5' exonuclease n=1 Tax=Vibrio tasmaniensis TaxID=212663 RepID=UPI00107F55C8|nr:3'-5' exonuclease [Vibrio tasmaniensis]
MNKVIQTKYINKCFRSLMKAGKKGKDAINKTRAAMQEAASEGQISTLKRTNNGENRLPNAEKYDLGDGFRLVVQLVDGESKLRAFLFAGDHEDTENWLDSHKSYRWVKSKKDNTLEFIQISSKEPNINKFIEPDLTSSEDLLALPLLRHISHEHLTSFNLEVELQTYIYNITSEAWECDPNGIIEHIEDVAGDEIAILFDDLFTHSHKGEIKELAQRINYEIGVVDIAESNQLETAMLDPVNSEIFVTWDEVEQLPKDASWADWLLFLHPEQKKIAVRDFKGSSRLRGVSGSGKTCVMLHRARHLAKKYKQPILLITLTESMRKLLQSLITELCGVEASFIYTSTVNGLAKNIIENVHPKGENIYTKASQEIINQFYIESLQKVKNHTNYNSSKFRTFDDKQLKKFLIDEIFYIRTRLTHTNFSTYLNTKTFKRVGRVIGLNQDERKIILELVLDKTELMKSLCKLDYEGVISLAYSLLNNEKISIEAAINGQADINKISNTLLEYRPYRSVLVDEVQDLSQLEIAMLASLKTTDNEQLAAAENGLFLVGDGAQTVYNKGFILKHSGVNIANRSYVLKKNYRNTKEIMNAAYSLIEKYEFADVDEDNIGKPTKPDLPSKCGEKPFIVKTRSNLDQIEFIVNKVDTIITNYQDINESKYYPQICIIGLNKEIRQDILTELSTRGIKSNQIRESISVEAAKTVSISTVESAKGFEFSYVFIAGVSDNLMPNTSNEVSREVSRLYVAMTRAEDELYITYSTERNQSASRFLMDFSDSCNELEYRNGQLKRLRD